MTGRLGWTRDHVGLSLPVRAAVLVSVLVAVVPVAGGLGVRPLFIATSIALWALIASGLNITVGYAGQLNLANGAFFALGAYLGALGVGRWDWSGPQVLVVAIGAAMLIALATSFVVFRAKGLYFALLTSGIAILAESILIVWSDVTGGSQGLSTTGEDFVPPALTIGPLSMSEPSDYLVGCVWLLALLVFALTVLARLRIVFGWQSVRDDEVLAASVGVKVAAAKRTAFVSSAAVAALGGVIFAYWTGYVSPESFGFTVASVLPLAMVIIGGSGTTAGPIIGAVIVVGSPEAFSGLEDYSVLLFGALLLAAVVVAPGGIVGAIRDVRERGRRPAARVLTKEQA